MHNKYRAIIASETQAIPGGFRQPWLYADGDAEVALGHDIVQTSAEVAAGDAVLIVTPGGDVLPGRIEASPSGRELWAVLA